MTNDGQDLSHFSMLDLFRMESETQIAILNDYLLALESEPNETEALEALMRAAHSIKGAARIVGLESAVNIAHVMEDCFVAAQEGKITLTADQIDVLFQGVDLLSRISQVQETGQDDWLSENEAEIASLVTAMAGILVPGSITPQPSRAKTASENLPSPPLELAIELSARDQHSSISPTPLPAQSVKSESAKSVPKSSQSVDRVVRISAENLSRLMGLAGESLVEANWLQPFADSLMKLKSRQAELSTVLEKLQESLTQERHTQLSVDQLNTARRKANECSQVLAERLSELELFARRSANLSDRLYREVITSHMRPFADGVQGFPRMIRDLARQLGKQVKFEILGKSTQVDRDILEKLESPLTHILRNAIDHGIESPQERLAVGKPAEGTVRLEAMHRAGMLSITISDDGSGIEWEQLRQKVVNKGMVAAEMAAQLTEAELIEFLFLPGFSTVNTVTEISGRGVGLDVAQSMVQEVGGMLRAVSQPGRGMSFHLQLPLTLSVMRTLLVEIAGEPYAFPLTRIEQICLVPVADIALVENRQYFTMVVSEAGRDSIPQNVGLVSAEQVLGLSPSAHTKRPGTTSTEVLPTIIVSDRLSRYGLVVDQFLGERNLVVRPLDPRLGKVPDISAVALMEDGSPVLVVDVEDLVRSVDNLLAGGQLSQVSRTADNTVSNSYKRILVVDDSITVREMQRKLLENKGYKVEVSVNGMDGWNAVRTGHYDLVITDIDMPRMNGIELVNQIRSNPKLKPLPVIIVSYKDREEDRIRGLEAGANYYLTKSSFHDDTLLNAVIDVIGEASA